MFSALVTLALAVPPAGVPVDRYFVTLYGSEAGPLRPRATHTWAVYTRRPAGPGAEDRFAVSWLPESGVVGFRPLKPVCGRNFTHEETLAAVARQGQAVRCWGPFETDSCRYAAALAHRAKLESGRVSYRPTDPARRGDTGNCVSAVLDADPQTAGTRPRGIGFAGTADVVARMLATGGYRPAGP